MTAPPFDQRRARIAEYIPWIARDYATNQGPATGLVAILVGVMTLAPALAANAGVSLGAIPTQLANQLLLVMAVPLVFVGVLFATNGIIANDRKLGYYRFLFSKPVSPTRYYSTVFLVHGAGLLLVTVALLGIWAVAVTPMFPAKLLLVVTIMYVAYGGLGFLLSAAWRFDWLSLVTVLLVANVGWSVWGTADGIRHWVLYILPPVHRANDVYALAVRTDGPIPWTSIVWLFGYGLTCFVAGLIVLRRRPLGTT